MKYNFFISEEYKSTRIDLVLSLLLPETSRSFIQKLIEGGRLTVNGKVQTSKKYKVAAGEEVEITISVPGNQGEYEEKVVIVKLDKKS